MSSMLRLLSITLLIVSTVPVLAETKRPNVLFIVIDDLRNSVGAFGDSLAITPNIDALASRGTVFANAHCQIAICNPSRTSVMTGLRPNTTQVWGLNKHFRKDKPNVVTLPQYFKQNGYYTHSIGKIFHGNGPPSTDPPSWSDAPQFDHCTKLEQYMLPKNRTGKKAAASEKANCEDSDYIDGKVADAAIIKLRELKQSEQPFFLAVGFRKPHMPFSAPSKYWAMHNREQLAKPLNPNMPAGSPEIAAHTWPEARGYTDIPAKGKISDEKIAEFRHGYYAATTYMDAQLGRVLSELKSLGLDSNTVISLYGDHGFHLGEHNLWGKLTNYDIGTKAPLLFASPFQKDQGATIHQAVEFIDIYPTLVELCGLKKKVSLEGTSLAAVLDDKNIHVKDFAISQFPRPVSYNFTKKLPQNMGYTIRDKQFRYTRWVEFKSGKLLAEELYDYSTDQVEFKNEIANAKYTPIVKRLKHKLLPYAEQVTPLN
ncbi:MAG: iduronate-2-sulfatase [Blastopirellula sp.]|nr:MAG: iduronate-2-sulfatase [Blastopirellula sp.]